ncbi:MAG TPA: ATP-binding protein [Alphaproteobacteria bacterium]|nr:ATP-binding protein [Alphaproteobacteria bacterium]
MRPISLGRNTALRLALIYMGLFSASILILMAFLYWKTADYLTSQADDLISADVESLREIYAQGSRAALAAAIKDRVDDDPRGTLLCRLEDGTGRLAAGNLAAWPAGAPKAGWISFKGIDTRPPYPRPRYVRAQILTLSGGERLLVGRSMGDARRVERVILQALSWGLGLTLVLGALGALLTSAGMVRRLEAINRTCRGIIGGDLTHRIARSGSGDDFDVLAANLNAMLDRIETLMTTVKGVSDSIAHELRTPLARVKTRLEMARNTPPPPADYEAWIDGTIGSVDAVLDTFEALLKIAEIEAGGARSKFAPVDLATLVTDVAEFYEPLAEDKGQRFTLDIRAPATVTGDRDLLFRALANLVDNAIKYTPAGGRIGIVLDVGADGPDLAVSDNGLGIPNEAREKVFQRLYRLEENRSLPGSGLGLSLVAAVASLHGIPVRIEDNKPGLTVRLCFGST